MQVVQQGKKHSTAMTIDSYLERHRIKDISLDHFEIFATDISGSVLDIARAGKYDSISIIRGLDDEYKNKYFTNEGRKWILSSKIRDRVVFRQFNLQNSFISLGKFDIVFCRYVLIYFSAQLKKEVFQN